MQCPYFKKINFQKIEQLTDIEQDSQKNVTQIQIKRDIFSFEDSIPEEGSTNAIKVQKYRKVNRSQSINCTIDDDFEEVNKIITIKMPKTLEIKQFNIQSKESSKNKLNFKNLLNYDSRQGNTTNNNHFQIQQNEIDLKESSEQISQQLSFTERQISQPKTARVFQTHRSIFLSSNFCSIVTLQKTKEQCMCHLNGTVLKILTMPQPNIIERINQTEQPFKSKTKFNTSFLQLKEQSKQMHKYPEIKVKYFIDLSKYKTQLLQLESSVLQLVILCKGNKQKIAIKFMNQYQRCSFQCVYQSVMECIQTGLENALLQSKKQNKKQKQIVKQDDSQLQSSVCSLNSERSIDSLKFTVERMGYKDTLNFLNTFDIILFKGKNIMSKVQRLFTNSDFDHVGLILKTVSGNLILLQATGNVGVAMYTFSSLKKALKKKIYERIAIRKYIQTNAGSSSCKTKKLLCLQDFVSQVNGKKYKFDPFYLISNSMKNKSRLSQYNVGQEQTFFCSQLVAQALKVCGIMKQQKPSYKFLPKHFGDVEGLNKQLKQGHFYSNLIVLQY